MFREDHITAALFVALAAFIGWHCLASLPPL